MLFFRDRERLLKSVALEIPDIISEHEGLLGRRVSECLPKSNDEIDMAGIDSSFAHFLKSGRGYIRATKAGVCGDSGVGSPGMALLLRGQARERIMDSEARYRTALMTRTVLRTVESTTISEGSFFMMSHVGLDNRGLLPPFFPMLRNEDGIFGTTLRACVEQGLIGHLPLAVFHDPQEQRRFTEEDFTRVALRLASFVILLLTSEGFPQKRGGTAERMKAAGEYLMRVGSLSERTWCEFFRERWLADISRHIRSLEQILEAREGSPRYWREDILARIEAFRSLALDEELDIPADLRAGRSPKEARALSRRLVRRYGELLYWWPVIVAAAKDLRNNGKGMLREL